MQLQTLSTLLFAGTLALPLAAAAADGTPHFLDRDLLTETLTADEQEPLQMAEAELATAQKELDTAKAERDAASAEVGVAQAEVDKWTLERNRLELALIDDPDNPDLLAEYDAAMANLMTAENTRDAKQEVLDTKQAIVDEKQGVFDSKQAAVDAILDEIALTGELVDQLSDKQVQAFNSAFNSAYKTGLLPFDIDSDWLQRVLDENLGTGPIHQLVTAYAKEARFERLAARFDAKADVSGDDKFTEHAERAREKGVAEYDKFVAKVDAASAREAAKEERRAAIRGKALGHSK